MGDWKAIFRLAHTAGSKKIKDLNWKAYLKRQQALLVMRSINCDYQGLTMEIENSEVKKSKSFAISSSGYAALIVGGLIIKFALTMWLGIVGFTLVIFGIVLVLTFNE